MKPATTTADTIAAAENHENLIEAAEDSCANTRAKSSAYCFRGGISDKRQSPVSDGSVPPATAPDVLIIPLQAQESELETEFSFDLQLDFSKERLGDGPYTNRMIYSFTSTLEKSTGYPMREGMQ